MFNNLFKAFLSTAKVIKGFIVDIYFFVRELVVTHDLFKWIAYLYILDQIFGVKLASVIFAITRYVLPLIDEEIMKLYNLKKNIQN